MDVAEECKLKLNAAGYKPSGGEDFSEEQRRQKLYCFIECIFFTRVLQAQAPYFDKSSFLYVVF